MHLACCVSSGGIRMKVRATSVKFLLLVCIWILTRFLQKERDFTSKKSEVALN